MLDIVGFSFENMILHTKIRLKHVANPYQCYSIMQNVTQQAVSYWMDESRNLLKITDKRNVDVI